MRRRSTASRNLFDFLLHPQPCCHVITLDDDHRRITPGCEQQKTCRMRSDEEEVLYHRALLCRHDTRAFL